MMHSPFTLDANEQLRSAHFFCGSGGDGYGFARAGFDEAATVDLRTTFRDNKQNGGHGVEAHDRPAHSVVAHAAVSSSRACVEDIRIGCTPRNGHYGVVDATEPSPTIISHHKPDRAPGSIADVRLGHAPRNGAFGVEEPTEPASTTRACHSPRQAPAAVADVRVGWDPSTRKGRPDCYGVADPDEPSNTVRSRSDVQSSRSTVADHRVSRQRKAKPHGIEYDERGWPIPTHTLVRHPDGRCVLFGPSTETGTGQLERIGNGIPCDAAYAVAVEVSLTITASLTDGFHLSSEPIWVQPEEAAHAS